MEATAEQGLSAGAAFAARLMGHSVAEEAAWPIEGVGYPGRVSIIRTDGVPVVSGAGDAARPAEAAAAGRAELLVQIVLFFGARIDRELAAAGYSQEERAAVANFVTEQVAAVRRMARARSTRARALERPHRGDASKVWG